MSELYARFLPHIPKGGRILDAGCGSGRDTQYFLQHGYRVEAFDASPEMCRLASILTGQPVLQKTFDQFDGDSRFDGVWACASLLHLTRVELDPVLERLCRALKSGGVMFMSFKLRNEEWDEGGRHFNGYDQRSFKAMMTKHPSVHVQNTWISDDVRPSRSGEQWLNALISRP